MSTLGKAEAQNLVMALFSATHMHGADQEERARRRQEIGQALMAATQSLTAAEEIVARAKRSFDEFPTLRQFEQLASAVLAELRPPRDGDGNCPMCHGSGIVRTTCSGHGVFAHLIYPAVRPCTCRSVAA